MEYTIEFRNNNDVLGNVSGIVGHVYCTSDYINATSVIIWVTYEGILGYKSNEIALTTTSKPISPTPTSTTGKQKGIKLLKLATLVVIIPVRM